MKNAISRLNDNFDISEVILHFKGKKVYDLQTH